MNDLSRYILAIVLAMIILFSWQIFFPVEQSVYNQEEDSIDMSIEEIEISKINKALATSKSSCTSEKVIIDNNRIEGSIDLCGAQINEIFLKKFNT